MKQGMRKQMHRQGDLNVEDHMLVQCGSAGCAGSILFSPLQMIYYHGDFATRVTTSGGGMYDTSGLLLYSGGSAACRYGFHRPAARGLINCN